MEIEVKKEYPSIHVLLCQTTKQLFNMVSSNFLHLCVIFCTDIKINAGYFATPLQRLVWLPACRQQLYNAEH